MFQSIALRATDPNGELPDFENHITTTHLAKIGQKIRNQETLDLLKRCADEFPTRVEVKKQKKKRRTYLKRKKTKKIFRMKIMQKKMRKMSI